MSIVAKYLGIPYKDHGRSIKGIDCYGLVKLFYKEELGIDLPDYQYNNRWVADGLKLMDRLYWRNFEKITRYEKYCCVGFRDLRSKTMAHIGIMVDDINFLHAPRGYPTVMEKITNRLWRMTFNSFYRYKVENG